MSLPSECWPPFHQPDRRPNSQGLPHPNRMPAAEKKEPHLPASRSTKEIPGGHAARIEPTVSRKRSGALPCSLSPMEAGGPGTGGGARVGIPVRLSPSPAPHRPVRRTQVIPCASGGPTGDGRRPRSRLRPGYCRRRASGGSNPCANPVPWRGNYLKPAPTSIGRGRARGECNTGLGTCRATVGCTETTGAVLQQGLSSLSPALSGAEREEFSMQRSVQ